MIKVRNLTKQFGSLKVLKEVSVDIADREVVVVIGPSGSGKSTFLRCINYLEEPTSGEIEVDNIALANDDSINQVRMEVGMVFQRFNLFPHMTVLENIVLAPMKVRRMARAEAEQRARELLVKVGLAEKADAYPEQLSGGQQQRVAIARALAMRPKVMLFDEPTSALDPELRHEVLKVMQDLAEEGMTMVIVTHEIGFAEKVASRLIFIDKGRIAEDGDPQVLVKNPPSPRLREFLQHVA